MPGVRRSPRKTDGKYQGWFFDSNRVRKHFTGTHDYAETKRIAVRLEDDHLQVRLGYRPARSTAEKSTTLKFDGIVQDYMDWGRAQGGRGGRPWSAVHAVNRHSQLKWWCDTLALVTLADLDGILPRVEKASQQLQKAGMSGKTISDKTSGLGAFCSWCIDRGYLETHPLKGLARFDTTPISQRRAATHEELAAILQAAPIERRLLYETAFCSGLRAGELRQLTAHHVDLDEAGIRLDAAWTKNRSSGLQPVPRALLERLLAFARAGHVDRIYEAAYQRGPTNAAPPKGRLLYVPAHTARCMQVDTDAAGVQRNTAKGKLDFHGLRVAYINFILGDSSLSPKEMQDLARHGSLDLTLNVYGRARADRLRDAAERIGSRIAELCVPSATSADGKPERKSATPVDTGGCASVELAPAVGLEPTTWWLTATRSAN
jgi:integrase